MVLDETAFLRRQVIGEGRKREDLLGTIRRSILQRIEFVNGQAMRKCCGTGPTS